jgi:hypothetical protein
MTTLTVILNNGSTVPLDVLDATVSSLKLIREFYHNPVALYDIFQKCILAAA